MATLFVNISWCPGNIDIYPWFRVANVCCMSLI